MHFRSTLLILCIVTFALGIYLLYPRLLSKQELDNSQAKNNMADLYAKCDQDRYVSKCGGIKCIDDTKKVYAFKIFKTAIMQEYGLSEDYFDKHFEVISATSRTYLDPGGESVGPAGDNTVVVINYLYTIGWIKRPHMFAISYWEDGRESFDQLVSETRSLESMWKYDVQESQIANLDKIKSLSTQKYKGADLKYDFCDIGMSSEAYGGRDVRDKMSLYLYGRTSLGDDQCVTSSIDLLSAKKKISVNSCIIE